MNIIQILLTGTALCMAAGCSKASQKESPSVSAPALGVVLATEGTSNTCITLAETASAPEKTAAKELAAYLEQVTGVAFPIVKPSEAAGRPVIAVGPDAAKALLPELDLVKAGEKGLGEDGIILKTLPSETADKGGSLILTGAEGSKRGTLYAVYEFLDREVGVRWWTHTEEFVPKKPTLSIRSLDVRYKPDFFYRLVYAWGIIHIGTTWGYNDADASVRDWDSARFAARHRNNGGDTVLPASLGGSLVPMGRGHTFYPFLPPETYFKDHPEWYSERGGKRLASGAQLCMTNDAMLEQLTENILVKVRENPEMGMVHLSQNDNQAYCLCENCKALDDAEGSASASMLYGVNKVADAIAEEFPDYYVVTFAYQYTRKPPKSLKPRPNVIVQYCLIERSLQQIDSDENQLLLDDLKGWGAVSPKLLIWDYPVNMVGPMAPHPNLHVYGPDFRTYRENNAVGIFCESTSLGITDFIALRVYLMSKLLWDPDRDEGEIMDEFLNGYYGQAGPIVRQVLQVYETYGRKVRLGNFSEGPDAGWLTLEAMNQATALFDQAASAVADDPARMKRLKVARISLDHQWLRSYARYREDAKNLGMDFLGPQDPAKAAADFSTFIRSITAASPEDYNQTHMSNIIRDSYLTKTVDAYLDQLEWQATVRKPGSLPAMFQEIPSEKIINIDDTLAEVALRLGCDIVADPKSTSGVAMRMPKAEAPSWGVQARTKYLEKLGGLGRYRVYAVIRCDVQAEQGAAFVAGVWDNDNRRGLGAASFPIGKPAPPLSAEEIDSNPSVTFESITSGKAVTDGEYHVYDFGAYTFENDNTVVWLGTTTSDIYIERFIFVREELPLGMGPWDDKAQATYTNLYKENNYVAARDFLEGIDFTATERLKSQYVSYQLSLDRAQAIKPIKGIDEAKAQVAAYASKIGLREQTEINYNIITHLYDSLTDKQFAYDYYRSIEVSTSGYLPVIATHRIAVRACTALKKFDEAKEIATAIGDRK